MKHVNVCFLLIVSVLVIAAPGCEEKLATKVAVADESVVLPTTLFISQPPADAIEVAAARKDGTNGQKVVVRGVIGGRKDPLAENRAILTLLDSSIKTCDKMPGDTCATPWDACCEPSAVLAANSLTVQVVDSAGKPLPTSLANRGGTAPLKSLVVAGVLRKSADGGSVTVDAASIYVNP